MNRRKLLGSAPCAALGSLGMTNALLNLRLINNATAAPPGGTGDYRALVCLFMNGGNDSFNMLVPTGTDEHANYSLIRSNLALPLPGSGGTGELLPINVLNTPGRTFGIHPALAGLQSRFNEGNAAFVANVGSLVEPLVDPDTGNPFPNVTARRLPRALFAHNSQVFTWQTSVAETRVQTGWGGRLADRVMAFNPSNSVSMNMSLEGNTQFLVGQDNFSFAIGEGGTTLLTGSSSGSASSVARVQGAKSMVEETQRHLLRRAFAEEKTRSYAAAEEFASAFGGTSLTTGFPGSSLGTDLGAVARSIAARNTLGHCRQIFFVQLGGFDNHDELLGNQQRLLSTVDAALSAFWAELVELGLQDQVTLFSCSDFGRTIRSNGLGTDHAWGGNAFVMGGAVRKRIEQELAPGETPAGSVIAGSYPEPSQLTLGGGLDLGTNGRYIPSTSIEEYFAELALWFGLPTGELENVFPNLGNFYTISPTPPSTPPLGFLL